MIAPDPIAAHDLGCGLLGTALREAVTARRSGDWARWHALIRQVSTVPITDPAAGGLFHGVPAVAFVLHVADHPAYRSAAERLDTVIEDLVRARLEAAHRRIDAGTAPRRAEFDLMSGLTGLGALLLHRGRSAALLRDVLVYLTRLLDDPVRVGGVAVPGWWSSDTPGGVPDPYPAGGHASFGLAHGVAGPLALLALAGRAGHEVSGQRESLRRTCRLLEHRALPVPGGAITAGAVPGAVRWPQTVTGARAWHHGAHVAPTGDVAPGMPSWCCGTPGVARALQLAALACGHSARRLAEDALAACLTAPAQLAQLYDPGLYHGWAGLRLTAARATADADPAGTLRALSALPDRPHTGPLGSPCACGRSPTVPGLLTGYDGPPLVSHTLDQPDQPDTSGWEICLLLDNRTTP